MVDQAPEKPYKNKQVSVKKPDPPPTQKEWDKRLFKGDGERKLEDLYSAIGLALSKWNSFEEDMARIFCLMSTDRRHMRAARRAFGAVRTFEGRLEMVREVTSLYFSLSEQNSAIEKDIISALLKEFKSLAKEWREYNSRRNEIAHGVVLSFPKYDSEKDASEHKVAYYLFWWGPADFDASKRDIQNRPEFAYNVPDLKHYATKFNELRGSARAFSVKILGLPSPFE